MRTKSRLQLLAAASVMTSNYFSWSASNASHHKGCSVIQTNCRCQKLWITSAACVFVLLLLVSVKKPSGALCLLLSYEPPGIWQDYCTWQPDSRWSLRGMFGSLLRIFTVCHKGLHTASGWVNFYNWILENPLLFLISSHGLFCLFVCSKKSPNFTLGWYKIIFKALRRCNISRNETKTIPERSSNFALQVFYCLALQDVGRPWSPRQQPKLQAASSSTSRPPRWQTCGTASHRSWRRPSSHWLPKSSPASSSSMRLVSSCEELLLWKSEMSLNN